VAVIDSGNSGKLTQYNLFENYQLSVNTTSLNIGIIPLVFEAVS
jgi:hypothetical protein